MNIYKTSVNNPITSIILFVAIAIMGIFSLDLSKPVNVQIHSDARKTDAEALAEALQVFVS